MNEPTNPSEPNPSDSTPPPPPPPPFTPPPSSSSDTPPPPPPPAPSVSPAAAPMATAPLSGGEPRPPIYTPPPGQPPKKSAMPWILGGCGCLTLIAIILVAIGVYVYRAKQKVTEFKNDFRSALKQAEQSQASGSVAPRSSVAPTFTSTPAGRTDTTIPRAGWNSYVNEKEKLPAKLQQNFVAFRFDYPKAFSIQPQSDVNFVKVEKYAAAGKGNTAENFAVGYAWFEPPTAQSDALYEKLLDQLGQQLTGGFHNYKELRRIPVTVDGIASRAALFQADFNDPAKTMIYGKTIVVHPPGKKNGVTILILGTGLSRDIKSADDLGTKGDSAEILRSFKFL